MEDRPRDHLELLGQLAREYQDKYRQLEEMIRDVGPADLHRQLVLQAEMTTDRFRAAQQVFLSQLVSRQPTASDSEGGDETYRAAIALCRCFDEMRILFQVLSSRSTGAEG